MGIILEKSSGQFISQKLSLKSFRGTAAHHHANQPPLSFLLQIPSALKAKPQAIRRQPYP